METSFTFAGPLALLGLGLVYGLKHATEVDHVVAVSTIVSEHRNVFRSALVGALWGVGHTIALLVVGVIVLVFRSAIPLTIANWLEFGVALMIIGLGLLALRRVLRRPSSVHLHEHTHDGQSHVHIHFHEPATQHSQRQSSSHTHALSSIGIKPVLVGTMHGVAGSGALTLLILTQIKSPWVGLAYLAIFGLGSVVGMLLMSGLIGLPFALTSRNLSGLHQRLQTFAALLSIAFGLWYAQATFLASGVL